MKNLWQETIHIGITSDMSFTKKRNIKVINMVVAMVMAMSLVYTISSLAFNEVLVALINFSNVIVALVGYFLHYKHRYQFAKFILIFHSIFLFVGFSILFGEELVTENFAFWGIVFVSLIYNKRAYIIIFCTLYILAFIFVRTYFHLGYQPFVQIPVIEYFYHINLIMPFVLIFFTLQLFKKETGFFQHEVELKNAELYQQKEEIETQRDNLSQLNEEVIAQRDELEDKNREITRKNKQITDSMNYARRIQSAMLPKLSSIKHFLPETFVFHSPKDIVSGDFYWFEPVQPVYSSVTNDRRGGGVFIAVADCTGHGVSGAMMAMLGMSSLSQIVNELKVTQPAQILYELDTNIRKHLKQDGSSSDLRDGMDIALLMFDIDFHKIYFAGAQRPLYLVRNKELIEYKGDKNPIGSGFYETKTFTLHEIDLLPDDIIYICTDGITDQFDRENKTKFGSKRLRELLQELQKHDFKEHEHQITTIYRDWKGRNVQMDDVLLIGIKF
ncbi:MAG: SpoIIE family protein phosphatase [Thermoflexibacter sp.]|nr:SpoIIE family protein phosphatase [Thermoflexibacter sp.]